MRRPPWIPKPEWDDLVAMFRNGEPAFDPEANIIHGMLVMSTWASQQVALLRDQ